MCIRDRRCSDSVPLNRRCDALSLVTILSGCEINNFAGQSVKSVCYNLVAMFDLFRLWLGAVLSSPWFKWLIFGKAGSAAGYATFRCTWQRTRRYLCYDLVADHSRTRAAKVSSEQAGQSGFSALAACPHPATGAGSGSG